MSGRGGGGRAAVSVRGRGGRAAVSGRGGKVREDSCEWEGRRGEGGQR